MRHRFSPPTREESASVFENSLHDYAPQQQFPAYAEVPRGLGAAGPNSRRDSRRRRRRRMMAQYAPPMTQQPWTGGVPPFLMNHRMPYQNQQPQFQHQMGTYGY